MKSKSLIPLLLVCFILLNSSCEKDEDDLDNYALVNTSIVATRQDASALIEWNIIDPSWLYNSSMPYDGPKPVIPEHFEVYLSENRKDNWKLIKTIDYSSTNNNFNITGLTNDKPYYVYLKCISNKVKETKESNIAMFVPSAHKPSYSFILEDYYGHDLYSFDRNNSNDKIVYGTKYFEYEPNSALSAIFIAESNSVPQLVDMNCWFPDFNSDGTKIAYSTNNDEIFDGVILPEHIAIYDHSTKKTAKVTSGYSVNKYPTWSPDNSLLAFSSSNNSDRELRITLLNPETLEQTVLETGSDLPEEVLSYSQTHPAWSSDGEYIYFTQGYTTKENVNPGYYDIYRIKSDGGTPEPVFDFDGTKCSPSISPDNSKLAFLTDLNGKLQIWVYNFIEDRYSQPFDKNDFSISKDWPSLRWKDNNTVFFSAYSEEKGGDYSLFTIKVE